MSTAEVAVPVAQTRSRSLGPLGTLARRRFQLTARTPRELVVPLLTPIMFALVIAPALKTALHTDAGYESFVAIGTVGLLIPLNTMFLGLGVIVDRATGAQRELLTAPIWRGLLVLGNLVVALAITALQVGVLLAGALETAHTAGIVHGDLSPSRLVLGAHGEPLLAETGLAEFAVFPGLGALNNPVRYHAPPEVLEHTDVTPATDVYSLAATVYALVAGRAPQQKPAEVTDSNASLRATAVIPSPRQAR